MTNRMRNIAIGSLILLGAVLPGLAQAQSNAADSRVGRWYIGGGFGAYSEEDNAQMPSQDAGAALFFSGGYRASANVAIEADLLGWDQDFSTPGSISSRLSGAQSRTDLTTSGAGAIIKFIAPLRAVDLYAGGGLGFYATNLQVSGSGDAEIDETETELGYQALFGADVYISRRISVGLEYRYVKVDANFEPYLNNDVDVGGQFFLMSVRGHF